MKSLTNTVIAKQFIRLTRPLFHYLHRRPIDLILIVTLTLISGVLTFYQTQRFPATIFEFKMVDVWFDSDCGDRLYDTLTNRFTTYNAVNNSHPLLPSIGFGLVLLVKTLSGTSNITSIRLVMSALAATVIVTLFVLMRLIGCRQFDALLFSILAGATATAQFWFVYLDSFVLGAESILLPLCLVAMSEYRKLPTSWYIAANVMALSITVTNWIAGIAATLCRYKWKQALQIFVVTIVIIVLLASLQKLFFPTAGIRSLFFPTAQLGYASFPPQDILDRIQVFFFHSIVMPAIQTMINPYPHVPGYGLLMTIQNSGLGSASVWGKVAVLLWAGLLALGGWSLLVLRQHLRLRITLGVTLLGALALHSVHGRETFLYAPHYAFLLIILASLTTLTRQRTIAIALALLLCFTASINNVAQLNRATTFVQTYESHRSNPNAVP